MTPERKRPNPRATERDSSPEVRDERVGLRAKKPDSVLRKLLRSPPRRSGGDPG
ncbi:MAG: hypothetical protein M3Q30_24605 [Actinomycetota bacterium]|nr:hypothetical protein [Actinomycetota bacterium]